MSADTVGQVCRQRTVTICANSGLMEVKKLMREGHADAVVVIASAVDRPTALGIITHEDVEHAELQWALDVSRVRVSDVLSRVPLTFSTDETIDSAIRRFRSRNARYALVTGSGGALFGLVSLGELLNRVAA